MDGLIEIVEEIGRLRRQAPRVIVAIGGFGGAGKSTLTRGLLGVVPDSVRLRGDDFLDPERSHRRSGDWDGVERWRMRAEVFEPFRRGEPVNFRPYDWDAGELGPMTPLASASILLVDAIGLPHPDLDDCFDLTVWVDVDLESAGRRGRERDQRAGHDHDHLWDDVWTPNDRDFAATFSPREHADILYSSAGR